MPFSISGGNLLFIWFAIGLGSDLPSFDWNRPQIHAITNIQSPVDIRFLDTTVYVVADFWEVRPGVFRMDQQQLKRRHFSFNQFSLLTQLDPRGLVRFDDNFAVLCMRSFEGNPEEWSGLLIYIDEHHPAPNRQENLPGRIQCPNRKPECGLVGAWVIDKTTLIGIKAKDPSQVMIMNLQEETWKVSITKYPLIDTHLIEPQSLRVRDSYIYLLARETWRLVRAPLNELLEGSGQNLQFEVVADLSFLHALFPHPNKKMDQAGYLESFDWGPNGNLWVLINPRGQDFSYSPDGDPKTAKLIEFEAIKP